MNEKRYAVIDERGNVLASEMSLDMALVLIKGIVNEYYGEKFELTVKEIPVVEDVSDEEWLNEAWLKKQKEKMCHDTGC